MENPDAYDTRWLDQKSFSIGATTEQSPSSAKLLPDKPVAVLYQATPPPSLSGTVKPANPCGYRDSSADIAFSLVMAGRAMLTPAVNPRPHIDADWSFPDSAEGISEALSRGAEILWANTSLFEAHPLSGFGSQDYLRVIGQSLHTVELFEDKHFCHSAIAATGITLPSHALVDLGDPTRPVERCVKEALGKLDWRYPIVVKPCRGRGSAGVRRVESEAKAIEHVSSLAGPRFGTKFVAEEYLPGEEWVFTVMPPGTYRAVDGPRDEPRPWSLPPVRRTGHHEGVMPFSGRIPPMLNSEPAPGSHRLGEFALMCVRVAELLNISAPIRIDCREDRNGVIKAIDVNLKPSMTGQGRPGRERMANLSAIAAGALGWTYNDLVAAIVDNPVPVRRIVQTGPNSPSTRNTEPFQ